MLYTFKSRDKISIKLAQDYTMPFIRSLKTGMGNGIDLANAELRLEQAKMILIKNRVDFAPGQIRSFLCHGFTGGGSEIQHPVFGFVGMLPILKFHKL